MAENNRYICLNDSTLEDPTRGTSAGVVGSCKVFKNTIYESREMKEGVFILIYSNSNGTKIYAPLDKFPGGILIELSEHRENKLKNIIDDLV